MGCLSCNVLWRTVLSYWHIRFISITSFGEVNYHETSGHTEVAHFNGNPWCPPDAEGCPQRETETLSPGATGKQILLQPEDT